MKSIFYIAALCFIQVSLAEVPLEVGVDRATVQTVLNIAAEGLTIASKVAKTVDQKYFADPEVNRNNTVKLYLQIGNALFDAAAYVLDEAVDKLNTTTRAKKLLECVQAQTPAARNAEQSDDRFWGECVTQQVPNLSIGIKDQLEALYKVTETVIEARDELKSCKGLDVLCYAQLLGSVPKGLNGAVEVLVKGTKEVFAAYKIMFGTDVPSCTYAAVPLILNSFSDLLDNVAQCLNL